MKKIYNFLLVLVLFLAIGAAYMLSQHLFGLGIIWILLIPLILWFASVIRKHSTGINEHKIVLSRLTSKDNLLVNMYSSAFPSLIVSCAFIVVGLFSGDTQDMVNTVLLVLGVLGVIGSLGFVVYDYCRRRILEIYDKFRDPKQLVE